MRFFQLRVLVATGLALAGASASVLAQAQSPNGYWGDVRTTVVKSGSGLCWRNASWSKSSAVAGCDAGAPPAAAAPAPVAAPAPQVVQAPAPMAAPTPEPVVVAAPVAVPVAPPAPAKPAETWKTSIVEKPIRLEGASFASGSSKLLPGAGAKLNEVVKVAKEHGDLDLTISGYTDNLGKDQNNVKLSQARAEAVKAYLVKSGVAASRIKAKGYGAESPLAENTTAAGRAKNRRVEIRYVLKEETKVLVSPQ